MKVDNGVRLPVVPVENQVEVRQVSSAQLAAYGQRPIVPGHVAQSHTPPPLLPNPLPASLQWPPEEFDPDYASLEGLGWTARSDTPPPPSPDRSAASPQWPPEEFDPDYALPEGPGWASRFPRGRSEASPDTLPSLSLQHRLPRGPVEGAMRNVRERHVQTPPYHAPTVVNYIPRREAFAAKRGEIANYARIYTGESDKRIARQFDVSNRTVHDVRRVFNLERTGCNRKALTEAERCEIALYAGAHPGQPDVQVAQRFGISKATVSRIRRAFCVPRTFGADVVRPAVGSFQRSRSMQADPGNLHIQRFLQQLRDLPELPGVIPRGDRWESLPEPIRLDMYGNDRLQFERELAQAATERYRIDAALARNGLGVVRNDGDHNSCLLISLLQHATGDYGQNHLARADAIRDQLIAERLIRLNEPMLFTGPETRRAVEIINLDPAVTTPLHVYSISDVAGIIAVDRVASPPGNSRDVLIWDEGGHFEAIAQA